MGQGEQVAPPDPCSALLLSQKKWDDLWSFTSSPGITDGGPQGTSGDPRPCSAFPAGIEGGFKPLAMEHLEQVLPAGSCLLIPRTLG